MRHGQANSKVSVDIFISPVCGWSLIQWLESYALTSHSLSTPHCCRYILISVTLCSFPTIHPISYHEFLLIYVYILSSYYVVSLFCSSMIGVWFGFSPHWHQAMLCVCMCGGLFPHLYSLKMLYLVCISTMYMRRQNMC